MEPVPIPTPIQRCRTPKLSSGLTREKPLQWDKPPIAWAVCCSTWILFIQVFHVSFRFGFFLYTCSLTSRMIGPLTWAALTMPSNG
jgi:hypothetical protein